MAAVEVRAHAPKVIKSAVRVLLMLGWGTAASAQNIANTRDANGNLIRRDIPTNNTIPMINSNANNPRSRLRNAAPTADQNLASTSDDVSRMLGHRE
jgi:hypothetical protein